jgi:ribose transport system ATP-binding protein
VIEVRGVSKRFAATVALENVDVSVRAGEVHALIGENGAGKSTLMHIIAGALRADRGTMSLAGQPFAPTSPADARQCGVALIHQELSLCPHLTVAENILLGIEPATMGWIDRNAARERSLELLRNFSHPDIHPDRRVGDLPLAAQQVVEICRALAADARVVLMDEPTSSFQRADIERLFHLIRQIADRGVAVVYISHFLEEVREIADGYTVLRDGKSVDAGRLADVTNERLIAHMVGRSMSGLYPARQRTIGEVVLSVERLASPPALHDASFSLRRGEILGVAGLIGSGRTEMVRALYGLDRASSGRVVLRDRKMERERASPSRRLAQGVGFVSEDRKGEGLALPLSIADNLTSTRVRAVSSRWGWLDLRRQRDAARRWMDALRIRARSPSERVRSLSGGNQQKVALGRLLFQDAEVLLLDEPTRGIDVGSKAQVYEAIAGCAADGKAVLMVSSYLPELFGMCDRIAVMRRGRLSAARAVGEWTPEDVMAEAIGETPHATG